MQLTSPPQLPLLVISRSPLTQDPQGRLWDAVFSGDVVGVAEALDAGASAMAGPPGLLESRMGGRFPLHAAAANNHVEVARLLCSRCGCGVYDTGALAARASWSLGVMHRVPLHAAQQIRER